MHLIYMDDSEQPDSGHQVIAAVIVPEKEFTSIESFLADEVISKVVPEDLRPKFEFHASKMFHLQDEFKIFNRDQVLYIFQKCVSIVYGAPTPVVYGAVDLKALRASHYSTAQPADIAFRLCMDGLKEWYATAKTGQDECGILICDDTKKDHVKKNMQQAYRAYRRRFQSHPGVGSRLEDESGKTIEDFLHDDMYFGDSAYSVGIQLADICAYIILRHLQGKEDTEFLYKLMEPQIVSAKTEPKKL